MLVHYRLGKKLQAQNSGRERTRAPLRRRMDINDRTENGSLASRSCGTCTLCCKVLYVESLAKPQGKWCESCTVGTGCRIYDTRPNECRKFLCGYLTVRELDESWRPSVSKLVVCLEG